MTETPADVVNKCSVTFCCLSDPFAVKEVVFGKRGVLEAITAGKGFVDMSTIDVDTVKDCEEVSSSSCCNHCYGRMDISNKTCKFL